MSNICNAPFGTLMISNEGYGYCCRCVPDAFLRKENSDTNIYNIYNSNEFSKVRKGFIDGDTPFECIVCPVKVNYSNDNCEKNVILNKPKIHRIQIMHDNKCNLSCKSCSSHNSSTFDKLVGEIHRNYKHKDILFEPHNYNTQPSDFGADIFSRFKDIYSQVYCSLNEVLFAGGEFMFTKENIEYLKLIDKSKKIMIFTNGTTYDENILAEMNKFDNCVLIFSIDGDNTSNHLIRPFAKYETIKKHLNMVRNNFPNIEIHINTTISILSMKTLPNTIDSIISDFINTGIVKYWDMSAIKHPQIYNLENGGNKEYIYNKLIESLVNMNIIDDLFLKSECTEKIRHIMNIVSNSDTKNYSGYVNELIKDIDAKLNIDTSVYMDCEIFE